VYYAGKVDWGNVPQWVSALLSGLSVLLALFIIFRDRRRAELEQAMKLAADWMFVYTGDIAIGPSVSPSLPYEFTVHLFNGSDSVITEPILRATPRALKRPLREDVREWLLEGNGYANLPAYSGIAQFHVSDGALVVQERSMMEGRAYDEPPGLLRIPPRGEDAITMPLLFHPHLYEFQLFFSDGGGQLWGRDVFTRKLKKYDALPPSRTRTPLPKHW